jgi:hypothetical protein
MKLTRFTVDTGNGYAAQIRHQRIVIWNTNGAIPAVQPFVGNPEPTPGR